MLIKKLEYLFNKLNFVLLKQFLKCKYIYILNYLLNLINNIYIFVKKNWKAILKIILLIFFLCMFIKSYIAFAEESDYIVKNIPFSERDYSAEKFESQIDKHYRLKKEELVTISDEELGKWVKENGLKSYQEFLEKQKTWGRNFLWKDKHLWVAMYVVNWFQKNIDIDDGMFYFFSKIVLNILWWALFWTFIIR